MWPITVPILFGLAGCIAVGWNVVWLLRNWRLLFASDRTVGTVARFDIHDEQLRARGTTCRYVVCYRVEGRSFELPAVPAKAFGVGQRVTVRYLPENPQIALPGWLAARLFGPAFMTTWGGTVLVVAVRMWP